MAYDAKEEQKLAEETTVLMRHYTLPDGRQISLGQVCSSRVEVFYKRTRSIVREHIL